jgi:hypothetical protein
MWCGVSVSSPLMIRLLSATLPVLLCMGCPPADTGLPDRAPGDRTPLSASCDETAPLRCLMPWPSNVFTVADATTATGLRLNVDPTGLYTRDDVTVANLADGFSRATAVLTGFDALLGDHEGTVRLLLAQHDHPAFATDVPVWTHVEEEDGASFLAANPYGTLEPNADYVAVVTHDLTAADGSALTPSRPTLLALALTEPETEGEERIAAYHAPTRATLAAAGIDPADVLVVWDFTTRSADDATRPLLSMMEASKTAIDDGAGTVSFDTVTLPGDERALIVLGTLAGIPSYQSEDTTLALDDGSRPVVTGTTEVLFRIAVPAGEGDYRVVMYGHGTGGSHNDNTLDSEVAAVGAAKVGFPFTGWGSDVIETWFSWEEMFHGVYKSSSKLAQALANAAAIQRALEGVLGDALAAPTLTDADGNVVDNPAAGRRPDLAEPLWAGGSLGGTMGLVYASAHPDIRHGVLNVPGAAWTQWIHEAFNYALMETLYETSFAGRLNLLHAAKMSQGNWDYIDGTAFVDVWRAKDGTFLVQSSMGDEVLPNPGSHTVALCAGAVQLGEVLEAVPGIEPSDDPLLVEGGSAFTQYQVPDDWEYLQRHGFASRDFVAGEAAREQIRLYLESVWAGSPRIVLPQACVDNERSCDFSDATE